METVGQDGVGINKLWLKSAGETLISFLHTGLYTAAMGTAAASIPWLATSKKRPDFLVESSGGQWHVFESKGGNHVNRYARIVQGLEQLHGLPSIGWASKPSLPARTVVCVHTSVDAGRPISVLAVDPPASGDGVNTQEPDEQEQPAIQLVRGVARLLVILQTIEYFDAMSSAVDARGANELIDRQWLITSVPHEGVSVAAIPKIYKILEHLFRGALAAYLVAQELFDSSLLEAPSANTPPLSQKVKNRLSEYGPPADDRLPALEWALRLADDLDGDERPSERVQFLQFCSRQLGIDFFGEWGRSVAERTRPEPLGADAMLTTGGMLIGSVRPIDNELEVALPQQK